MNKLIFSKIINDFFSIKCKFLTCTITYYSLISFIPAMLVVNKIFSLMNYKFTNILLNKIGEITSPISIASILLVATYLVSRIFRVFPKKEKPVFYFFISLFLALSLILFLAFFIATFSIESSLLKVFIQTIFLAFFLLIINHIFIKKTNSISFVISLIFSTIISCFLYLFEALSPLLFNYENYYGFLAPLFLTMLEIHLIINLIYLNYLCTKNFQLFWRIKIVKM